MGLRRVSKRDSVGEVIEDPGADVVRGEEILEGFAVEERGPLVVLVGAVDLDAEDLLRVVKDLPDAKRLVLVPFEDLDAQGIDDAIAPSGAQNHRVHGAGAAALIVATGAAEEFERAGRSHGEAKHTQRRSRGSSMRGESMESAQSTGAPEFAIPGREEPCDGQEDVLGHGIEGDSQGGIIVLSCGGAEECRMQSLLRPGHATGDLEEATGGQAQGDDHALARGQPFRGGEAKAAESDLNAPGERGDGLAILGRDVDRGAQR